MAAALPHLASARSVCPHCWSPLFQSRPSVTAEPDSFFAGHLSCRCAQGCRRATYWCRYMAFFRPDLGKRGRKEKTNRSAEPYLLLSWSCYWHSSLLAAPVTDSFCTEPVFRLKPFFCGCCTPTSVSDSGNSFVNYGLERSFAAVLLKLVFQKTSTNVLSLACWNLSLLQPSL